MQISHTSHGQLPRDNLSVAGGGVHSMGCVAGLKLLWGTWREEEDWVSVVTLETYPYLYLSNIFTLCPIACHQCMTKGKFDLCE